MQSIGVEAALDFLLIVAILEVHSCKDNLKLYAYNIHNNLVTLNKTKLQGYLMQYKASL